MNFGLGLVLSFTDNATAGINNAVNSLSQLTQIAENASNSLNEMASLSALSVVADRLGSGFLNAGKTIIGTLTQVVGKVNETGRTLMYAENQLNALYKDDKAGKRVIGQIQQYAKESMFEFENLIPSVIRLKSVGIEAFDKIAVGTEEAKYNLLDYASALASFAPQMRNAYGTGIKAAIGAMQEYIAEGNALSLKRGAGLDITALLGEDKGATIEERTQQIAKLVDQMGMLSMVDFMKDSPQVKLSNMGDVLFQFVGMVSQSGVFDAINGLIDIFADFVMGIDESRLQSLAKTVGSALTSLIKPLEIVAKWIVKLAEGFLKLLENNPGLAKFVTIGVAVVGVLSILIGMVLKFTSALSGLSLFVLAFGKNFGKLSTVLKTGSLKLLSSLLPLTMTLGLIYLAWKHDFAGIKTSLTNFVSNLRTSFADAKQIINGSVGELKSSIVSLRAEKDPFSNFTIGLVKLGVVAKAVSEAWNDYTLSEDTYLKAKELGVLPLIEAILDLKYRFGFFKEGFIAGWTEISDKIKNIVKGISKSFEGTFLEDALNSLTNFLQALSSGDTQAWYDFGEFMGKLVAKIMLFKLVIKPIGSKILDIGKAIRTTIPQIISFSQNLRGISSVLKQSLIQDFTKFKTIVTSLAKALSKDFTKVVSIIKGAFASLKAVLAPIATTIAGIVSLVVGIAMAVTGFVKQLIDGFSWFWEIIKWIGIALGVVGAILLGVATWPAVIVGAIIGIVTTIIVLVKQYWNEICEFFKMIGTWIYDNVIKPVADFFVNLWNGIVEGVKTAIEGIKNFFSTIANWIYSNVIQPIVNFFMTYIYPFIEKIVEIVLKIIEIVVVLIRVAIQQICTVIGKIASWIYNNVIMPVANFFVGLWNGIVAGVTAFVSAVCAVINTIVSWIDTNIIQPIANFFTEMWNRIVTGIEIFIYRAQMVIFKIVSWILTNIIQPISDFFTSLWEGIVEGVTSFIETVKGVFTTIVEWINTNIITPIANFFTGLWEKIQFAFNTVADTITEVLKGAVNTVFSFIGRVINGVIRGINTAIGIINAIPGVSISKITELNVPQLAQGGVIDKPTMSIIGEAGTEAVMPLENNTEWIGVLANMLHTEMQGIRPTNTHIVPTSNAQGGTKRYLTNNNSTTTHHIQGDTDNSIIFNEGAIQVNVQNASEEEALRMAKKILIFIKRQKELEDMMQYV